MKSQKIIPIVVKANTTPLLGVIINHLPEDQQKPFNKWLHGQTVALINIEGEHWRFAYASDYETWYNSWIKDEVAEITD